MSKRVTIAVIGKGKVGTSLARSIAKLKPDFMLFAHIGARQKSFAELGQQGGPEVIFICSKDDAIARVAKKAVRVSGKNLKMIVHCSGSNESTILPSVNSAGISISRLTLHPIQTFPHADAKLLKGIYYMASTGDRFAKNWADKFVKRLHGRGVIHISPKDLPLYHTLVVFASNFTTLLGGSIEILSRSLGIAPAKMKRAVMPLMKRSIDNVRHNNSADVLTGPLVRNDRSTIMKHRKALAGQPAPLRAIYEGFVKLAKLI
ncbi:MAG: DUF2520 domain-containing protein [Bacteroidota bacterium]|nr:DUF2520 domain-containing protein [Bacteroidota bacterium]MDP4229239.1 DUF2520 domain-containing protein [Bacteroidota bacterium]